MFTSADEIGIDAGLVDKVFVLALLDDMAMVNDQKLVGMADRLQAVCGHDDGLIPGQGLNGLLQAVFVLRVNACGCLSRMTMGAFFSIARAMEIRCFSPPERDAPPPPTRVSKPCSSSADKAVTFQQQPELVQMVVHVVHQDLHAVGRVIDHPGLLRLAVHLVKALLNFQEPFHAATDEGTEKCGIVLCRGQGQS